MANKPPADDLLEIWRRALAEDGGINLATRGITSSMVYWADVLYASPAREEDSHESVGNETIVEAGDEDLDWRSELGGNEKDFVDRLAETLNFDARSPGGDDFEPQASEGTGFERIPLPWFIKRRLMKILLRDVHHYLFNAEHSPRQGVSYRVRDEIRDRLITALRQDSEANAGKGAHLLVSHSMGTVIAYDCLKRVPDCPQIDAFMTIGSPLGIDEVQDQLKPEWTRQDGYPGGKVRAGWANVYDRLDPVAYDAGLDNDFMQGGEQVVQDQRVANQGKWRHSIHKYLSQDPLRRILAQQLGVDWS
jgi:pimeloyl-ACP methyl ester carboxylesterase